MEKSLDDVMIWDNFREGNKDALSTLFKKYYPELFRYGLKITDDREMVNDSLQDLFIDIWQQKTPSPVLSIKAYLLKAMRYKLLKQMKLGQSSKIELRQVEDLFHLSHESFLIKTEQDREKSDKLLTALQQIPARQKEIIYLWYYLNLGYKEICEIMNIEYQVARNQLANAIKNLKRVIVFLVVHL